MRPSKARKKCCLKKPCTNQRGPYYRTFLSKKGLPKEKSSGKVKCTSRGVNGKKSSFSKTRKALLNATVIWQQFLTIATEEVGSRVVETWLKAISVSGWDSATKTVYLRAPNAFIKDWVMGQYTGLIKMHLCRLLNESHVNILFLDESKAEVTRPAEPLREFAEIPSAQSIGTPKKIGSSKTVPARAAINQRYLFETFVVGQSNALAFAAAEAVAESPGELYNPLLIYGGPGLGKTHLLQAVGNHIKQSNPKSKILYQSADRFVHDFITAIRFDKVPAFEQRYREVDVLLIDDIQFIARKQHTQEAFYHIFNALYEARKQIVVSSDALPSHIDGLADRLRSRLEGALIADLQPPCQETKVAILQKKAEGQKEKLSDGCLIYCLARELKCARA